MMTKQLKATRMTMTLVTSSVCWGLRATVAAEAVKVLSHAGVYQLGCCYTL